MRGFLTVIITMVVSALGVGNSDAQELDGNELLTVKIGSYQIMDIWDHIKLGTAPYINPRLLEKAAVGYSYEPNIEEWDLILEAGLYDYFKSNKYTFGKVLENDEIKVAPFYAWKNLPLGEFPIDMTSKEAFGNAVIEWIGQNRSSDWALIGVFPELAGVAGDPIVTWSVQEVDWIVPEEEIE